MEGGSVPSLPTLIVNRPETARCAASRWRTESQLVCPFLAPIKVGRYNRPGLVFVVSLATLAATGCSRQSRGNSDAQENRAATPAEGGATSMAGSAGEAKNFGDTQKKTEVDGRSPSASATGLSQDATAGHNVQTSGAGASTGQQSRQAQSKQDTNK